MKKAKSSSKINEQEFRICWLETNLLTTTVRAKSPEEAVKQAYDFTEDRTTLIYGQPLPDSAWCVDSDDVNNVPEPIAALAESLNVNIEFFIEDELRRLKNPAEALLRRLIVTSHVEPGKLSRPSSGGTRGFVPSCNVRIASPEQLGTNC